MKYLSLILFVLALSFSSCKKDKDKKKGVCYCEFVKGDDQEYDLSNLSRDEQQIECNRHDSNAGKFGGKCKLE